MARRRTAERIRPAPPCSSFDAPKSATHTEERRTSTEPLSPGRYKVELTISTALKDKIARATDLMRHRNPSGELAMVLERAIDLLIAELEKERFGKTKPAEERRRREEGIAGRASRLDDSDLDHGDVAARVCGTNHGSIVEQVSGLEGETRSTWLHLERRASRGV